jgi:hypothetical protein
MVKQIYFFLTAGRYVQRKTLGLPENWDEVESWIDDSRDIAAPAKIPSAETALKTPR